MKFVGTIATCLLISISFAQEKVNYTGLNKKVPVANSFGIKAQANYYFSSYKTDLGTADSATVSGSEITGGGMGFYYRYHFNTKAAIQGEFLVHHRQGKVVGMRRYDIDTAITMYNEELSGFNETWIEIPVYFKYRWEFTYRSKGHWKSNSALGVFIGPRAVVTPFSRRDLSRSTYSVLYGQETHDVENNIDHKADDDSRFAPIAGFGVAGGVDFEFRNGLLLHAAFYRGITSHAKKSHGYKIFDNRIEAGIGIRIF